MTADDLHARADCARRNPVVLRDGKPVVTITCDHADAIAALIDAADALVQPAGWWMGVEQRQEHQLLDRRAVVRDALAALDGTP